MVAVASLTIMPLASMAQDQAGRPDRACQGFVVLANGHAVWSEQTQAAQGDKGHQHGAHQTHEMTHNAHDHSEQTMKPMTDHGRATPQDQDADNSQHLMGHQHGQAVAAGQDGLCVPLGRPEDTTWTAVSRTGAWSVTVSSLRGALAHNSRANEGFDIAVLDGSGKPLEHAEVKLFVRMPQHDHGMPGGHGPANDPDVKGIAVTPDQQGHYRVNTVDFSMPGPWLLEVVVKNGRGVLRAYVAPSVGEE
jgi:hypothetical protein